MPLVEVYLGDELDQTIVLTAEKLTIGRSSDNQLPLRGPRVLAQHAELALTPGGVNITDLGSDNGTLLDGEPLRSGAPAPLTDGARITIGVYTLIYRSAERPADPQITPVIAQVDNPVLLDEPVALPQTPRPTQPLPWASGPPSRYLADLPALYQNNEFLGRYLQIFETIWEPLEQRQDHIALYFDLRTAPEPLIGWLASWMDFVIDPYWPEPRRRRMAAEAFEIYRWRGTRYGLERLLEVCTGLAVAVDDEPAQPFVVRVRLKLPQDRAAERMLIEDLIRAHKPAHVGYVLDIELIAPAA